MTGAPAKFYEQTPTNCRITEGTTLIFDRTLNTSHRQRQRHLRPAHEERASLPGSEGSH